MKKIIFIMLAVIIPTALFALDRPNALEVKKVIEYYKKGKGKGVILVETVLCKGVHRRGPNAKNPTDIVTTTAFKQGETVLLWMNYLVPEGDRASIHFEFIRRGKVRRAEDITITGATRYRSWKRLSTSKKGTWEVVISQELPNRDIELSKITYTVE
jgi:hypothetical protein